MTEPQDFPVFRRNGHTFTFFDCHCDDRCLEGDCKYCAFLEGKGECPAQEEVH